MTDKYIKRTEGFTLVELSIVIIIIGFLIAGIAAGNSLIKQSALSSVVLDMQGFQTAYNNFVLRYSAVPGDMVNAENYWPYDGATPCSVSQSQCNGDGDGVIRIEETYGTWKQLSLANMINASVPAMPDNWRAMMLCSLEVGVSVPASKVSGAGYIMIGPFVNSIFNDCSHQIGVGPVGYATHPWEDDGFTNAVFIAKDGSGQGLGISALTSVDAFNLDAKIDDGAINSSNNPVGAQSGKFRSVTGSDLSLLGSMCTIGSHLGGGDKNVYNFALTTLSCVSGLALN
jgi:prepilin-type N-terminal cleavage/methylation domain-containing protein